MTDTRQSCNVEGCERTVEGGGWCAMHRKRLQRLRRGVGTLSLEAPAPGELSPLEEVIVAADRLLDASAEDDREYTERLERFRVAVERWGRSSRSRRRVLAATDADVARAEGAPEPAAAPVPKRALTPEERLELVRLPPRERVSRKPRAISALDR